MNEYLMALQALLMALLGWFTTNPDVLVGIVAVVLMAAFGEWDLKKMANDLIPQAEKQLALIGAEKREWVVDKLYALLPLPVRLVLPRALVSALVQSVFNRAHARDLDHSAKLDAESAEGKG